MNSVGDWLLFSLPIMVMIIFYDQHFILNGLGNFVVTAVLGVLVFMGSELLKPYVTSKRSLLEIDDDIKQYYYRVYEEKGLKFIEESLS